MSETRQYCERHECWIGLLDRGHIACSIDGCVSNWDTELAERTSGVSEPAEVLRNFLEMLTGARPSTDFTSTQALAALEQLTTRLEELEKMEPLHRVHDRDCLAREAEVDRLRAANEALASLVRGEYGDMPLAEIAATWGFGITDEQIAALQESPSTGESE
jgi:hypothetical protein